MGQQLHLLPQGMDSDNSTIRRLFESTQKKLGFVPNMYGYMANAPDMLQSYLDGYERFRSASGFSSAEQEVVLLSISCVNRCSYCIAAHSFMAEKVSGVPLEVIHAIRQQSEIPDERLKVLSDFTRMFVSKRGWLDEGDLKLFLAAGFNEAQVLDLLLAVSVKTLSNYANHLFSTPLDEMFLPWVWHEKAK